MSAKVIPFPSAADRLRRQMHRGEQARPQQGPYATGQWPSSSSRASASKPNTSKPSRDLPKVLGVVGEPAGKCPRCRSHLVVTQLYEGSTICDCACGQCGLRTQAEREARAGSDGDFSERVRLKLGISVHDWLFMGPKVLSRMSWKQA